MPCLFCNLLEWVEGLLHTWGIKTTLQDPRLCAAASIGTGLQSESAEAGVEVSAGRRYSFLIQELETARSWRRLTLYFV